MFNNISIHAPAKGATKMIKGNLQKQIFQSTLPRRERPNTPTMSARGIVFQSTLPRRERLLNACVQSLSDYFNPRSREGSDVDCQLRQSLHRISIHAPAKGATPFTDFMTSFLWHFNPRSREGSDVCPSLLILSIDIFQSTLPRRERQIMYLPMLGS